ncbi:MAG: saccharopine dehydrogenase-like oxidoreductase [Candidatus Tectomicrobia bacterium]|uniref:Saccharopine dehydrogenase-like oxidoreductase n=1 Tax=Tectimicrobiota bacterium TaxID=2528274 RepID=A0A932CPK1_UNCTE|nr:saccharopine dehydrogenase-like oxidoreductase [Candidatus Tectomicrobia bacterium]
MRGKPFRVAVLGAGGLGQAAARFIATKREFVLVAICDQDGYAYSSEGLKIEELINLKERGRSVGALLSGGVRCPDSLGEILALSKRIDGIFVALPNLPNEFIPGVLRRFTESGYSGVFTDALKRTRAMELMFQLDENLKAVGSTYITGAGATPGLLTAAAVLAAQSFRRVDKVEIHWGVGIDNWEEYRATIREDIAHLPGYSLEKAQAMTDEEVEALLDKKGGRLEFQEMEHADDLLLEKVGVVSSRKKVVVGGVMDTRSAKKPVTTTMTLSGVTYSGRRSQHRFILGDETTMADNVVGTGLGYLKRAQWLKERGIHGVFGSTEFMPIVVR